MTRRDYVLFGLLLLGLCSLGVVARLYAPCDWLLVLPARCVVVGTP